MPNPKQPYKLDINTSSASGMQFKVRYNTHCGNTDLFWRLFLTDALLNTGRETMYLVTSVACLVPSFTLAELIGTKKQYSMSGMCNRVIIDADNHAIIN